MCVSTVPWGVDGGRGCGYNRGMSESLNLGGRPRLEVDLDRLAYLASIDASIEECAASLGVSVDTLERRLREEPEWPGGFADFRHVKRLCGQVRLRERLDMISEGKFIGKPQAQLAALTGNIWLSKQRLGYSDRTVAQGPPAIQISAILVQQLPSSPQAVIDAPARECSDSSLLVESSNPQAGADAPQLASDSTT